MININPSKELFVWGPIDARPIYPDIWFGALVKFGRRFVAWPSFLMWVHDEKITFICEYAPLRDIGEENFKKFILPDKEFKQNFKEWQDVLKDLFKHLSNNPETKITKETKEFIVYVQGNRYVTLEYLEEALQKVCSLIIEICGGTYEIIKETFETIRNIIIILSPLFLILGFIIAIII